MYYLFKHWNVTEIAEKNQQYIFQDKKINFTSNFSATWEKPQ